MKEVTELYSLACCISASPVPPSASSFQLRWHTFVSTQHSGMYHQQCLARIKGLSYSMVEKGALLEQELGKQEAWRLCSELNSRSNA